MNPNVELNEWYFIVNKSQFDAINPDPENVTVKEKVKYPAMIQWSLTDSEYTCRCANIPDNVEPASFAAGFLVASKAFTNWASKPFGKTLKVIDKTE